MYRYKQAKAFSADFNPFDKSLLGFRFNTSWCTHTKKWDQAASLKAI
jgi:hypothetical protein